MVKRTGLGKGLDALIPAAEPAAASGASQIPIEKILANPRQPRTIFNDADLAELADSIREHGVIQPLILTNGAQSGQYTLIAGERRLRAAQMAGLQTVPAIVRHASEQQRLEIALIENVQRADLTALETAEAYQHLHEEFNLSHEEIAARVGKSRASVTNTLRLLRLPDSVRAALAEGKITEGHARALLALATPQSQAAALQTILQQALSVRQTEELVRKLSGQRPPRPPKAGPTPEVEAIEARLRSSLGTRVSLRHGKKGGTLTIHYYSEEELNAIIDHIIKE
ncbi:MAG TPA: ParB/RepB/Spo0J family partition protein [Anaerolineaceae bacterium]|nr:ParB/RepB/Spo0J family partition protein [Anaerolineaceae bacterium]HPN53932.1 ParB/RepB/Spo0J family partition protein [Anaerolineaceae bacterium]